MKGERGRIGTLFANLEGGSWASLLEGVSSGKKCSYLYREKGDVTCFSTDASSPRVGKITGKKGIRLSVSSR